MNLNFRFSRLSRRTLRSVVRAIGPLEIGIEDLEENVIDQLEAQLRRFPRLHRFGFLIGLTFLEWGAPLGLWGLRPFSLLSREAATQRLYRLLKSRFKPISHLVNGLRVLVCLSAYGRTDVEQWFGFERRRWRTQRVQTRAQLLRVSPETIEHDHYARQQVFNGASNLPPTPEALYLSADQIHAPLLSWEAHHRVESPFPVVSFVEDRDDPAPQGSNDD